MDEIRRRIIPNREEKLRNLDLENEVLTKKAVNEKLKGEIRESKTMGVDSQHGQALHGMFGFNEPVENGKRSKKKKGNNMPDFMRL